MKTLNILIFLLIFNTFILLGYLTSTFTGKVTSERISVNVTRVIDGDTADVFIFSDNLTQHCRLLGINTPEKKQPFHDEAMNFLKQWEGKFVELEDRGKDKYDRTLGYIFYNNQLINSEILRGGLASLYVYDKDNYYQKLASAEQYARDTGIGLWKKSQSFGCIKLVKLSYRDGGNCKNQEQLILKNDCKKMQVILKDDANHIYDETLDTGIFSKNFSCIWNDAGDSVYIRDDSGLLLFYRYRSK